ncbi:MAG TPA: hypothetical protein P5077_10835 [bacterium]|nr:hypothetical protein [bacterium]
MTKHIIFSIGICVVIVMVALIVLTKQPGTSKQSEWKAITTGENHTCGIKAADNQLYCWGDNFYGQLGIGTIGRGFSKPTPTKIGNDEWSVVIASGTNHTCGIKTADNKLYCWGDNYKGQLGDGTVGQETNKPVPTKIGDDTWSQITAGGNHTCGIKTMDKRLYCWGDNSWGQLGDGTSGNDCLDSYRMKGNCANKTKPTKIGNDAWSQIVTGQSYTCGIKAADNQLYCWGYNHGGKLGAGTTKTINTPTKIGDDTWSQITAGGRHTCGIKVTDKKLYCWGENLYGQLGNGTMEDTIVPTKIDDNTWLQIAAGGDYTCGIQADNKLYCWGSNAKGQLGNGTTANTSIPTKTGDDTWSVITSGGYHACGIKVADNRLYCWGNNNLGQIGMGTMADKPIPTKIGNDKWLAVSTSEESLGSYTCGIKMVDKKLYCWGNNADGQLGNGTINNINIPTKIGDDTWSQITTGENHTCGIRETDKKLYCWGKNYFDPYEGADKNANKPVPTKIGDDAWVLITARGNLTCGIKTNNNLYCWRADSLEQRDNDNTIRKPAPIKIGIDKWSSLAVGNSYFCAINIDGQLYCWGDNFYGQLGDGTTNNKSILIKIGGDTWSRITAKGSHTCGIKASDKKLYCWGENSAGQLGDGTTDNNSVPTKIGDDAWSEIMTGSYYACGIKTDKTLYCWGRNDDGQLGDGTAGESTDKHIPTKIGDDTWSQITTGGSHTCGIKTDNKLYCWGSNFSGQLGDGTAWKSEPTLVIDSL